MNVRILYFAKASELSGTHAEELSLPDQIGSLHELLSHLVSLHPALAAAVPRLRVARNEAFAELDERPEEGDVIALIPPVAGG
jgi:molybdopterin synthase sulfur carrier subunit